MKSIVLSIEGGGIRGIVPCLALAALEQQTGKLTRDVLGPTGFIGGTSTGAALCACVVAGVPATDALKVYTESGPKVFSPTSTVARDADMLLKGHQFDNKVLHQVVLSTLSSNGAMLVNDSPVGMMITAGDQMGNCIYFVKDAPTNAQTTGTAPLVDAAVGSCCATTYHAPWLIPGFGYFSDGGTVSLADPIYQTMAEAFSGYECYGSIDPKNAVVISLGTGYYNPTVMPPPPKSLLAGIKWVTGSLVGSSKTLALEAANRQWPGLVQVLNPPLWADVDEADVSAIPQLVAVGQKAAAQINWKQILGL